MLSYLIFGQSKIKIMKKLYWLFFVAMAWCGCYDDKGNYDYRDLEELQVAIKEEGPHSLMYGDVLRLTSEIKTSISDTDLQYDWEIQMDTVWYNPFVSVAQGRDLNYKWENAVLNKEKAYKMRLNVMQISTGRHFYSKVEEINLTMYPSALGLMVLHGDGNASDIGVIEAPEFQLQKPSTDFQSKIEPTYYSSKNGEEKIPGVGTGLYQTYLKSLRPPISDNIVVVALTEKSSTVTDSKTMVKKGEWNDMFIGGLNAGVPMGIDMLGNNLYIFDGKDIFSRQAVKYRVALPVYEYEEGGDGNGFEFRPQIFELTSNLGRAILFDKGKSGFVTVRQLFDFSGLALMDVNEPGIQIPFNPGKTDADLLHWDTGGKYGMLAVMKSKSDGSCFIAEMNPAAEDMRFFPKYKYDLSHVSDVKGGYVVNWAFGDNQINMGYYATPLGVYHFALDEGNRITPVELVFENNSRIEFEGDITLMKILKPRATGEKTYYMNNVVMVVGTYEGTSGSGKLYSLELEPNSGKVKSLLGKYEGFDRIYEVEMKGY